MLPFAPLQYVCIALNMWTSHEEEINLKKVYIIAFYSFKIPS